ncbi:MAG: EFR1 family ferrodoxin [Synergistaceae bacterium]|nr:EFR1 family ferrodoxin [Synergistaceae bacterium]
MSADKQQPDFRPEFKPLSAADGKDVGGLARAATATLPLADGSVTNGRAAFERYISPLAIENRRKMGFSGGEAAYVGETLVGFIEMRGPDQISLLCVDPKYRGRGLAERLIARAASRCAALNAGGWLWPKHKKYRFMSVHAPDSALSFYERVGFVRGAPRKEVGGIASTLCRLPLPRSGGSQSGRLTARSVALFVFSGTGNTLAAARAAADGLRTYGISVSMNGMHGSPSIPADSAVGLAFPVACFSTYPTVRRFIEGLPAGEGREVFVLGTCGGFAGGMQGPLGAALRANGYRTIAAKFLKMPGNYSDTERHGDADREAIERAEAEARSFAIGMIDGSETWGRGIPLLSRMCCALGRTRLPWDFFYRMFPIKVDESLCLGKKCWRCVKICPAGAVSAMGALPSVNPKLCESCQRCVGFCPSGALFHDKRNGVRRAQYRAMSFEDFTSGR